MNSISWRIGKRAGLSSVTRRAKVKVRQRWWYFCSYLVLYWGECSNSFSMYYSSQGVSDSSQFTSLLKNQTKNVVNLFASPSKSTEKGENKKWTPFLINYWSTLSTTVCPGSRWQPLKQPLKDTAQSVDPSGKKEGKKNVFLNGKLKKLLFSLASVALLFEWSSYAPRSRR